LSADTSSDVFLIDSGQEATELNSESKTALGQKLAELKSAEKRRQIIDCQKQIALNVTGFAEKYRFADPDETVRLHSFIAGLDFSSPAHIAIKKEISPECENVYLCFLAGTAELMEIFVFGHCSDILRDLDDWSFFSPYILLVADDFSRYICIDDNGSIRGAESPRIQP